MWLTGNDAINRFDGSRVKVYNLDRYFEKCPNLQQGYGFAEDDENNIYVGSGIGMYIYMREKDKFKLLKYTSPKGDKSALPIGFKNGKIWFYNTKYEVFTLDPKSLKVHYEMQVDLAEIKSLHIYDNTGNVFYFRWPLFDKRDNLWFIGLNTVFSVNLKTKKSVKHLTNDQPSTRYISANYDVHDDCLILGSNQGIIKYSLTKLTSKKFKLLAPQLYEPVYSITSNKDFYVAWSPGNYFAFISKAGELLNLVNKPTHTDFTVLGLGFDKSGRLWFCRDGMGQVIFKFGSKLLQTLPNENDNSFNFLQTGGFATFGEFENGQLLVRNSFAFDSQKLEFNPLKFIKFLEGRNETDPFKKGIWLYGYQYSDKEIRLHFTDGKTSSHNYVENLKIQNIGVWQHLKILDKENYLAAFTSGLYWLDPNTGNLKTVENQPYNNAFYINPLSKGQVAISYLNKDMYLAKIGGKNQIHFVRKILPGVQSFYALEDIKRKQIWVASNEGLFVLDKNFKLIKKLDANHGLAGTYIYGMLQDKNGIIWCSHQHGMSSIDPSGFLITNYTKTDGIQDWDYNNRAFYQTKNGTLFFGGTKGFNFFTPPLKHSKFYSPKLYVDNILVNNRRYSPKINSDRITHLKLNPNENNIIIHAFVRDLEYAKDQFVVYKLNKGKLLTIDNGAYINFANLAPDDYTLEIGYINRFNQKPVFQKTIKISIANPFYRTILFWVIIVLLILVFIVWTYQNNKLKIERRKFQQQVMLDSQRQKITADLHDDLGASLSSLQINSSIAVQMIDKNPSKSREIVEKVERQSQEISEKIGDFIWSMTSQKNEFNSLSDRIKTYTNSILESTEIAYSFNIDESLDALIQNFTVRKNLVLISKEAVNNVAKHSQAKNVRISLYKEKNHIVLAIADNGRGITNIETQGNGLKNMRKRSEEMRAEITFLGNKPNGTIIEVRFIIT